METALTFSDADMAVIRDHAARNHVGVFDFIRDAVFRRIGDDEAKAARNAAYLAKLRRADEQIRNGQVVIKTIEELEEEAEKSDRNAAYLAKIERSLRQFEEGRFVTKTWEELERIRHE